MIQIIDGKLISGQIIDKFVLPEGIREEVCAIIQNVIENKDRALYEYGKRFDGVSLPSFLVPEEEFDEATGVVEDSFISVLREAAGNIYNYHKRQRQNGYTVSDKDGVVLGMKLTPIERVGLYVPGGTASYPSSVLMNCLPAKIAGVSEIYMATPPAKDGKVNPHVLAAAKIAGVDKVYKVGGAQAIAALAYGTETIPKVDKIVGPGNVYVTEAKRQVFGAVDIDMTAGPSEILIIADSGGNPAWIAADMLSQAEHDRLASAILVTNSRSLAQKVSQEIEKQLRAADRAQIAREAIDKRGKIIVTDTIDEAFLIANEIAPEHLEVALDEPMAYLSKIKNAGSIFLGKYCPEALGDYFAGTNHTLPTNGTARWRGPLGVDDFIKKSSYMYYTKDALSRVYEKIDYFARKEGLTAHGASAVIRFEDDE